MKSTVFTLAFLGLVAASPAKAQSASCEDGLVAIASMSKIMGLSDLEQANIEALMVKAKQEGDQGKQRNCKLILADAIRFFLIKSVIQ
jgi:hypothetical protein